MPARSSLLANMTKEDWHKSKSHKKSRPLRGGWNANRATRFARAARRGANITHGFNRGKGRRAYISQWFQPFSSWNASCVRSHCSLKGRLAETAAWTKAMVLLCGREMFVCPPFSVSEERSGSRYSDRQGINAHFSDNQAVAFAGGMKERG